MECSWSAHGVHGKVWGSVKYSSEVQEYIQLGRCKHSSEGKIVLPCGSFVPRDIPGDFLKVRIDEWHRRNPERLRANGYAVRITSDSVASPQTLRTVPRSHFEATATAGTSNSGHYVHNRIASIERHLFQLQNHKTDIGNNAQSSSHPSDWCTTCNQPSSHCA